MRSTLTLPTRNTLPPGHLHIVNIVHAAVLVGVVAGCGEPRAAPPVAAASALAVPEAIPDTAFARLHVELSGPGAYFDTDNLISNEDSYLHAVSELRDAGVAGGVYLGVGPDQNYSYIAVVQPSLALIVDIRRDNALVHLLFKVLFEMAEDRQDYLCLLFGRDCPDRSSRGWSVSALLDSVQGWPRAADEGALLHDSVRARLRGVGIALASEDLEAIAGFHGRYMADGPLLRFNTHGRAPNPYYPTYRRLLLETDRGGEPSSFVATEEAFRAVKSLHEANRIVPLVGDLGGSAALRAVARWLESERPYLDDASARVSAFYVSNVEFYLMQQGGFGRFMENLRRLPRRADAVIIRSYFNRMQRGHPSSVPGYYSTQMVRPIEPLLEAYDAGRVRTYGALIR